MNPNFELLARAHAIIDGIPASRFKLAYIAQNRNEQNANLPHDCGTVGCAMGWLGMHPEFMALGLKTTANGHLEPFEGHTFSSSVAAKVFNISEMQARSLFAPVGHSIYDGDIKEKKASDKRLFKYRMRRFFIGHGQPVREVKP